VNSFFGEVNLLLVAEALEATIEISGGFEPQPPEVIISYATGRFEHLSH
jgi:hypothetical protein